MSEATKKAEGTDAWANFWANLPPPPPRTAEVVGKKCANVSCHSTRGISFEKPLCYKCWKLFDEYEIDECGRCHWFDEHVLNGKEEDLCSECFDRERRGFPPGPMYAHATVVRRVRYLYILKLDGGDYYVGQTNDLEIRLAEHGDGRTRSTRGKHSRLVWFKERIGNRKGLNLEEDRLTRLVDTNPRAIRRIVADWQRPFRLVDWQA